MKYNIFKIFLSLIALIKKLPKAFSSKVCPFCNSQRIIYIGKCLNNDRTRSSIYGSDGIFTTIPKSCWQCKDCMKKFLMK